MEIINPNPKSFQIKKQGIEDLNNLSQGVTRRLLEKYKLKGLYGNESMSDIHDKNRVA